MVLVVCVCVCCVNRDQQQFDFAFVSVTMVIQFSIVVGFSLFLSKCYCVYCSIWWHIHTHTHVITYVRALKPPKMPNKHFIKFAYRVQTIVCFSYCVWCLYFTIIIIFYCFESMFIVFVLCVYCARAYVSVELLIFHHRYKSSGEWCWRYDKDTVSHTMWLGHRNAISNVGVMEMFLWYCSKLNDRIKRLCGVVVNFVFFSI